MKKAVPRARAAGGAWHFLESRLAERELPAPKHDVAGHGCALASVGWARLPQA